MADLSDVEAALVNAVTAIAYPNGVAAPSALSAPVRIYRGLPSGNALVSDGGSGIVNVSVFPVAEHSRDTTRWGVQVFEIPGTPGLTVAAQGNSATFSGTALSGDLAGVLVGGTAYVYAAQPGDSASLAAASLGTAVRAATICWVTEATLTVPGFTIIVARTASPAMALEEWARQEQEFRLSVWAPSPQTRDAACSLIGSGLATITFLTLADGTGGRLRYKATGSKDDDQASSIYRRDLIYTAEYGTTVLQQSPTVLFGDLNWDGQTIMV